MRKGFDDARESRTYLLAVCLDIWLHVPALLSPQMSGCTSGFPSVQMSGCMYRLPVCPDVWLHVRLSVCPDVWLHVRLSVCSDVWLHVWLPVRPNIQDLKSVDEKQLIHDDVHCFLDMSGLEKMMRG